MLDPASLTELGLVGLLLAAFVAGSIMPFPSEVVRGDVLALGVSAAAEESVSW